MSEFNEWLNPFKQTLNENVSREKSNDSEIGKERKTI